METHREVGESVGLTGKDLDDFVAYMLIRWPKKELDHVRHGYSNEWASRFKYGNAYTASDNIGREILESWGYKD